MIARQDTYGETTDVWAKLCAAVSTDVIYWRQDGKVTARDGKFFARFVAYVEASTVRDRLDSVVPGEWDLTLELLPPVPAEDGDSAQYAFKARLQILGVIREDVGTGRDYKQASTDAFKRAAVRFGVAHELYAYEQNWVEMDGDGRHARPVEDPQLAYARRHGTTERSVGTPRTSTALPQAPSSLTNMEAVSCPKCGGPMWDNRLTKRNPRAPDYKCQNRSCDGVIWPARIPSGGLSAEGYAMAGASGTLTGAADEMPF